MNRLFFYFRQKFKENNYPDNLDALLENKVSRFAANLRQPLSDIKNLSYRLLDAIAEEKKNKIRMRIITLSDQALETLKEFEEEATGYKLISKKNNSEASKPAGGA